MRPLSVSCLFLALALGACGPADDSDDEASAVLVVTPESIAIDVINGVAVEQPYTAVLHYENGTEVDVTDSTSFIVAEAAVGYFDGTTLVANGAGRGTIVATHGDAQAMATVEVFARDVRVGDGVDPSVPGLFDAATDDPARAATIVYPSDGTIVPPNLGDFDLHWRDASGSDVFELSMSSYYAEVRVYVAVDASAGAWIAFLVQEWSRVAHSEIGATIDVAVRGLTFASPATSSKAEIVVRTSRHDILGGLYYWAAANAGGAEGIFRHDLGRPGEPAEEFYTSNQTPGGRCVACHALSRDGTRMAVTYDGGDGGANVLDVASRTTMMPSETAWNFAAFNRDGSKLLTVSRGVLTLRDPETGAVIATPAVSGASSHPDFAPQGDRVVYVREGTPGSDWSFSRGSLVTRSFDDATDTFGAETALVTSAGENNYYPSLSPDGQWVLFNRSAEGSYNAASAELWVVKVDGSVGPIKLDASNIGPALTNSWARWAPFEATYGPSEEPIFWLTFSSKRDFGVRLVGVGRPQLWMTPFFPARAAAGVDPTAPAFRLPFQDLQSNNHIAQWTEEVIPVD